jgi:hypothetical protein
MDSLDNENFKKLWTNVEFTTIFVIKTIGATKFVFHPSSSTKSTLLRLNPDTLRRQLLKLLCATTMR